MFSAPPDFTVTPFLPVYNRYLDTLYGTILLSCSLLGLCGNLASLLFFLSKGCSDVSNTVYKLICCSDALLCATLLPMGVCFMDGRRAGLLFGDGVLCNAWVYVWSVNCRLSIFLVVVLSVSRALSLTRPFSRTSSSHVLGVVVVYVSLQVVQFLAMQLLEGTSTGFDESKASCSIVFVSISSLELTLLLDTSAILTYVLPIFVVAISCVLSIRKMMKPLVRCCNSSSLAVIRNSRHRATVTILLFALVYALFNIPLVVSLILWTIDKHHGYTLNLHAFDSKLAFFAYYDVFTYYLSTGLNAALNPALYLWRMGEFRMFVKSSMGRLVNKTTVVVSNRSEGEGDIVGAPRPQ